jgi:hypothetical protein
MIRKILAALIAGAFSFGVMAADTPAPKKEEAKKEAPKKDEKKAEKK